MTTTADPGTPPTYGQLLCPLPACRGKRFFVYVVKGHVEVTCTECGARANEIAQAEEVAP